MKSPFAFCPACGAGQPAFRHGKELNCANCGFHYFHNVATAVGVFIRCGGDCLFAVRGREPGLGRLDLPGGFVEPGETLEQGLQREISEELGIALPPPRYLFSEANDYFFDGVLYHTADAIFAVQYAQRPRVQARDDVADVRWLALADVDLEAIAFSSIRRAVQRLRETSAGMRK